MADFRQSSEQTFRAEWVANPLTVLPGTYARTARMHLPQKPLPRLRGPHGGTVGSEQGHHAHFKMDELSGTVDKLTNVRYKHTNECSFATQAIPLGIARPTDAAGTRP
jgi:hypothetical protein